MKVVTTQSTNTGFPEGRDADIGQEDDIHSPGFIVSVQEQEAMPANRQHTHGGIQLDIRKDGDWGADW